MESVGSSRGFETGAGNFWFGSAEKYSAGSVVRVCGVDWHLGFGAMVPKLGRPDGRQNVSGRKSGHTDGTGVRRDRWMPDCTAHWRAPRQTHQLLPSLLKFVDFMCGVISHFQRVQ